MCTNISFPVKSKYEPVVSARTMDFVKPLPTIVSFVPRSMTFPENAQPGEIRWKNQYAFLGMLHSLPGYPVKCYSDGINETGLSAAALWLECSIYPKLKKGIPILCTVNVVSYVLGTCRSIREAEEALLGVAIFDLGQPIDSPLHYIVSDANGNHLIVEFIEGKMKTYVNRMGVLTNAPALDWHLTNLMNYENLKLVNNPDYVWGDEFYGSGQLGSPGDVTSPSRFVRADLLRKSSFEPGNLQQSIGFAQQVLETLSVPCGTSILASNEKEYDWTQWGVIRDHTNRSLYFYTAFNSRLYGVHLQKLDVNELKKMQISINHPMWYADVTDRLNPS